MFEGTRDLPPGPKTIADIWQILPYENYLVTAELTHDDLRAVMEEMYVTHDSRSLVGFDVQTNGAGPDRRVVSLAPRNGRVRPRGEKYIIAFNTFDSRSAGQKFMKLRSILESAEARCLFHHMQTRDALIDYFRRHKVVRKDLWSRALSAAA